MKNLRIFFIFLAFLLLVPCSSHSQQLRLSVDGGVSKMVGPNFNEFNWGFAVGGHLLFYIDNNILLGIRSAYNRWTPQDEEFSADVSDLLHGKVKGNAWTIEIIPTIRLTTDYPMSFVNFFAQVGFGAYILSNEVKVEGISRTDSVAVERVFGDGARGRLGLQAGGGFSFGSSKSISVDIFSLYNLVFTGSSSSMKYFSMNVGLSLNI